MARGIGLVRLQANLYAKFLDVQRCVRYLSNPTFEEAYANATEEELLQLAILIDRFDKIAIENWVHNIIRKAGCYENYTMKDLRDLAKELGVPYYKFKTRDQLLSDICKRKETGYENSNAGNDYQHASGNA